MHFTHNQAVFIEGQKTNGIYFIKEGEFLITKKKEFKSQKLAKDHLFIGDSKENSQQKIKLPKIKTSLKIIIKGENESIGGYEILNNIPTRQDSCVCKSSNAEVFYVQKETFFSRIPNIETIKEIIEEENFRLNDRFEKNCEIEDSKNNAEAYEQGLQIRTGKLKHVSNNALKTVKKSIFERQTPSPLKNSGFFKIKYQSKHREFVRNENISIFKIFIKPYLTDSNKTILKQKKEFLKIKN